MTVQSEKREKKDLVPTQHQRKQRASRKGAKARRGNEQKTLRFRAFARYFCRPIGRDSMNQSEAMAHRYEKCLHVLCAWLFLILSAAMLYAEPTQTSKLPARPHNQSDQHQSIQQALDTLTRAEIAREEATFTTADFGPARQQLRTAIASLQSIHAQLTLLGKAYQKKPSQRDPESWTVQELESLLRNLQVQQARAYRNQALCYVAKSPDRLNALNLALEKLVGVVTLPLQEAIVWQARLEQVTCLRLLEKRAEAGQAIDRWLQASPPAEVASRLTGERLKIALQAGNVDHALAIVKTLSAAAQVAPETDDTILEVWLVAQRFEQAAQQLKHIAQTHGSYWQRRAELRFGQALTSSNDIKDPQLLGYAAASLYAAGKVNEATSQYDHIATLLAAQGQAEQAFQARQTAAAITRESGQTKAVLMRFRQLALDHPQHPQAARLHFVAIGQAAELTHESPAEKRDEAFEEYLMLLREHLKIWPGGPFTHTAQQWLDRSGLPDVRRQRAPALAKRGKRSQALTLYRQLWKESPGDAPLAETLAALLAAGTDQQELREALRLWHEVETRSKPGSPRWKRGRQARLQLLDKLGEGEQAQRLRQLTKLLYE